MEITKDKEFWILLVILALLMLNVIGGFVGGFLGVILTTLTLISVGSILIYVGKQYDD
jgi:hypothetical protein